VAIAIYKPGQGYWTRLLTAIGILLLVGYGVVWLVEELNVIRSDARLYWQAGAAVVLLAAFGALVYWTTCRSKRMVDFMIATEAEMRKVNWPSRKGVVGSTIVVIGGTALFAVLLFVVDLIFSRLFLELNILQGG